MDWLEYRARILLGTNATISTLVRWYLLFKSAQILSREKKVLSKFGSLVKKPMQYVNALLLVKAIMFELRVYCYGVLRYTIIGDLDMLQELRDRGYYVQANPALRTKIGLDVGNRNDQFMSIGNGDGFVHHDDDFGMHKLAEERPDDEHYTFDFH